MATAIPGTQGVCGLAVPRFRRSWLGGKNTRSWQWLGGQLPCRLVEMTAGCCTKKPVSLLLQLSAAQALCTTHKGNCMLPGVCGNNPVSGMKAGCHTGCIQPRESRGTYIPEAGIIADAKEVTGNAVGADMRR